MAPLTPLQRLRRLDKASPQFPRQLTSLLHEKGYRACVMSLQGEDLLWLVEYLDNVCPRDVSKNSSTKPP
jgi:hypothetical protein